jgi:hypothetical protein
MSNGEPAAGDRTGYAPGVRVPASTVPRVPIQLATDACRLRAVGPDDRPLDRTQWSHQLTRLLAHEIRRAMAAGVVTDAEADQLLARLVLVIDQAVG